MTLHIRRGSAFTLQFGPFVDKDGNVVSSATVTPRLSKKGASWVARNDATAIVHTENGYYTVVLDATDTNTLGSLKIASTDGTNYVPVFDEFEVTPETVYDALYSGSNDAFDALGRVTVGTWATTTATDGQVAVKTTDTDAILVDTNSLNDVKITTARANNLDNLDVTVSSRATQASVDSKASQVTVDNIEATTNAISGQTTSLDTVKITTARANNLDNLDATVGSRATQTSNNTIEGKVDSIDGRIPGLLVGGRMDSNIGALDSAVIKASAFDVDSLDAPAFSAAAVSKIQAGLATAAAVGAVAADVWTQTTRTITGTTTNALNAMSFTADAANKYADHLLRRTYANARASANGDTVTFRSLLGAVAKLVNRSRVNGPVLETYHEDDATLAGSQTLTTDANAEPITGVDTV